MLAKYSLKLPKAVYAGEEAVDNLAAILQSEKAEHVVLFTDKGIEAAGLCSLVTERITKAGASFSIINDIPAEPEYSAVQRIADRIGPDCPMIIALGGGSVMDTAKLVSVLSGCTVRDLLGNPRLGRKRACTIMIPTTAGTGSEATPNAIVAVPEDELKVGIVNDSMIADYVILDPVMIQSLPRHIAAATGLDALAHAIECYTSLKANPFSDTFALKALTLIMGNIEKACDDISAIEEKRMMQIAAFYAGIAITSSGTTAVHALSYPLGGRFHIAHGVSNAILLSPVMRFNMPYCLDRLASAYDASFPEGERDLSREEKAEAVITRLEEIVRHLGIPRSLRDFGIKDEDIDPLASSALEVQRLLVNNARPVSLEDARSLYLGLM